MGKAEKTRQFIIETAAPIFNEKGIAGTSIDDVLKATKVAKGCLYGHFENKEALSLAMVDYMLNKVAVNTRTVISREITAKNKLFAFMDIYKNPLVTIINGGCPILNFSVESDDTNPAVKEKVKSTIQMSIKMIADIIKDGILNNEFQNDFNADEFALKTFTLIEGGIIICRILNNNKNMLILINMLKAEIESYQIK